MKSADNESFKESFNVLITEIDKLESIVKNYEIVFETMISRLITTKTKPTKLNDYGTRENGNTSIQE